MVKQTEAEWLAATEHSQLHLPDGEGHHRKWRLFAAGCCRQAIPFAPDPRMDELAEAAERFADGAITWDEVKRVRRLLSKFVAGHNPMETGRGEVVCDLYTILNYTTDKVPRRTLQVPHHTVYTFGAAHRPPDNEQEAYQAGIAKGERAVLAVARCVFGNPFRPVAFDPTWRTADATRIATHVYNARDFARLPVLADALEDSGCDHPDLLAHLRGPGPHVRGCWAVDLVLSKG